VFAIVGAGLIIGAVSWFANDVRIEHEIKSLQRLNNPISNDSRYRIYFFVVFRIKSLASGQILTITIVTQTFMTTAG